MIKKKAKSTLSHFRMGADLKWLYIPLQRVDYLSVWDQNSCSKVFLTPVISTGGKGCSKLSLFFALACDTSWTLPQLYWHSSQCRFLLPSQLLFFPSILLNWSTGPCYVTFQCFEGMSQEGLESQTNTEPQHTSSAIISLKILPTRVLNWVACAVRLFNNPRQIHAIIRPTW